MYTWPKYPIIYEINTWIWLGELGQKHEGRIDLGSVPAGEWDYFSALKVDAVWFMGVWERSPAGIRIALQQEDVVAEYRRVLPDFTPEDVVGSPYCVRRYRVDENLGGPKGLAVAREELARRGIGLILDFVPNHTAHDCPWIWTHPGYYIQGNHDDLAKDPSAYFEASGQARGARTVIACGRDPYFPPWQDTAQVNAFDPGYRSATVESLCGILEQCDGVRCDMAMLLINEIFAKTWGPRAGKTPSREYWVEIIGAVRKRRPAALFIAEAYWDMEWELQQQGFDFCYDKRLYDRLVSGTASETRLHLLADASYQDKLLRFIENHDEKRAAAVFPPKKQECAAVAVITLPGAKLIHDGQLEGRKIKVDVALRRRPPETLQFSLNAFYDRLLNVASSENFRDGEWRLCDLKGWPDNQSRVDILAWCWRTGGGQRYVIALNLSGHRSQGLVQIPWQDVAGSIWILRDLLNGGEYERDGDSLQNQGLYVDLVEWGCHFFKFLRSFA
jgi:hypothetical protein